MRINNISASYNRQNFGAKFSPEFEAYAREYYKYVHRCCSETAKKTIDKDIELLKKYAPNAEIVIEKGISNRTHSVYRYEENLGYSSPLEYMNRPQEKEFEISFNEPVYQIVVKQGGKKLDWAVEDIDDYKNVSESFSFSPSYPSQKDGMYFSHLKYILRQIDKNDRDLKTNPRAIELEQKADKAFETVV